MNPNMNRGDMNRDEFDSMLQAEEFGEITDVQRDGTYALGDHAHPFDACALITAGDITLTVNGVATHYAAGEIFRLAAHTPHLEHAGPQGVQYRVGRRHVAV
jgi:hypothetical protein